MNHDIKLLRMKIAWYPFSHKDGNIKLFWNTLSLADGIFSSPAFYDPVTLNSYIYNSGFLIPENLQ